MVGRGLLLDFGGVLTTSIWECFDEFCRTEGLPEGAVRRLFRDDPEALADLRLLETGEMIEHVFGALAPERVMIEAVARLRAAGVRTGLISNSWGTGIYDPGLLD